MDPSKTTPLPAAGYVNLLRVAQNRSEFYLTFGQLAQTEPAGAHLVSSLVTSPAHAKSMLRALEDAVRRYEERFGEIELPQPLPGTDGRRPQTAPPRASRSSKRKRRA